MPFELPTCFYTLYDIHCIHCTQYYLLNQYVPKNHKSLQQPQVSEVHGPEGQTRRQKS